MVMSKFFSRQKKGFDHNVLTDLGNLLKSLSISTEKLVIIYNELVIIKKKNKEWECNRICELIRQLFKLKISNDAVNMLNKIATIA